MTGVKTSLLEKPEMVSKAPKHEHIGITFAPPALYAPEPLGGKELAILETLLPTLDAADFDYTLNGVPGAGDGIRLVFDGYRHGIVHIDFRFMESYTGPWPAHLHVRYMKNGVPLDMGLLQLKDIRTAVPHRMIVDVSSPTLEIPPPGKLSSSQIFATLVDSDRIPFPFDRDAWQVHLDNPPRGVSLHGIHVQVLSDAQPGTVEARVTAKAGFEETVTLTIVQNAGG
jgi:hypothetical protein